MAQCLWIFVLFVALVLVNFAEGVLQCYECSERFFDDCSGEQFAQPCIEGVHDVCYAKIVVDAVGKKSYEKKCATRAPCESLKDDWEASSLCHGEAGAQCLQCCDGDLCNVGDFTLPDNGSGSGGHSTHSEDISLTVLVAICLCRLVHAL